MKLFIRILSIVVIVVLTASFTPLFAKQAPSKSSDQSKAVESKTPTDSIKKKKIQPFKMELVKKGDKLYLELNQTAKGLWLDRIKKGVNSIGKGTLIEVTPYLTQAKKGKLTFVVTDAAGNHHKQQFPVSKYASLSKSNKPKSIKEKKFQKMAEKVPTKKAPSKNQEPAFKQPAALSFDKADQGMHGFKVKRVFSKDGRLHVTIIRAGSGPRASKSLTDIKLKIDSKGLKLNKSLASLVPHWKTSATKKREFDIDTGLNIQKREWVTVSLSDDHGQMSSKKMLLPAVEDRDVKNKTIAKDSTQAKGKPFVNVNKLNTSQHGDVSAQRPKMMGTTTGRMNPTPEDRIVGSLVTSTESLREMAEESEKLKPVSGLAQTQAPQMPEEPLGIEQIADGIDIEAPTPGTQVRAGNSVTIRWEYKESVFEEYRDRPMAVDLYARSTEDPTNIVWTFMAGSDREIDWHVPSETPAGIYLIGARFDSGTIIFTGSTHIEVLPSSDLVLVWPPEANPGETILYVGYEYPITWNAYGDAHDRPLNVSLMNGSASVFDVLESGFNPPSERYGWLVGGNCNSSAMVPRGDNFRIRISTTDEPTFEALSAPITIRLPTIAVDQRPRSSDSWRIGNSNLIVWNSDHVPEGSTVKLSLLKGGSYDLLIDENQPNTGIFVWEETGIEKYTGPTTSGSIAQRMALPGDDYSIRIEMEDCDLVYGISPVFELYE